MSPAAFELLTAYDVVLIALSLLTALVVSQAVSSVIGRVVHTGGSANALWVTAGGLCLGAGIWTMHLTASLVGRGPEPQPFPLRLLLLTTALAISGIGFALLVMTLRRPAWVRALVGGVLAGGAFAAMHLLVVTSLERPLVPGADWRVAAALTAAFALGWVMVIWMAIRLADHRARYRWAWRLASGFVLAGVVAGATLLSFRRLPPLSESLAAPRGLHVLLSSETVLALVSGVLLALLVAIGAAYADRRIRRRRAETEALRRSEDRFRSLVQVSTQIVWTTAPDGAMLGEQPSWSEFTGQNASSYGGWGWFNAIHPEDRERTARFWEETLANRRSMELEHRLRRYDGQYRDCIARLVPVLEPSGSIREWVGTHTDVTDRTRMQQERDLLAEAGRVLSSSLDDQETLGAVARLLVPRIAEWCAIDVRTGDRVHRLVATHRDPNLSAALRGVHRNSGNGARDAGDREVMEEGESRLIREMTDELLNEIAPQPPGRNATALGGSSLLRVPLKARGQVLGLLTLASPTEGAPYDLRDLALAEELARRAAVAVDNARLYSTSQAAIAARDEVLGIVSHDLRNPIGTIATASELLLDVALPAEERRRHIEIIRRSATAANRLISDLLDVTQSDSGQLTMDLQPTNALEVVRETCEMMRPLAEAKGLRLTLDTPDRLPIVQGDPTRLQQVFGNLIGNAIKFVPAGGAVEVRAAADSDGVRFSVADTGPGIPTEDLPRLFDRHWRARKTAHLGAGLGLAISKGIVDAHDGRIWAESAPGVGTTFHLVLPAAREAGDFHDGAAPSALTRRGRRPGTGSSMSV